MASIRRASARAAMQRKKKLDEPEYCVYLGPSIRGVIQYGAIIHSDYKNAVREMADGIERFPLIKNLIVTGEQLPAARQQIKTPGNGLYAYNQRLLAQLAGKEGGK